MLGKELVGICHVLGCQRRGRSISLGGNIRFQDFLCRRCYGVDFRPGLGTMVNESSLGLFKVLDEIPAMLKPELQDLLALLLVLRFRLLLFDLELDVRLQASLSEPSAE